MMLVILVGREERRVILSFSSVIRHTSHLAELVIGHFLGRSVIVPAHYPINAEKFLPTSEKRTIPFCSHRLPFSASIMMILLVICFSTPPNYAMTTEWSAAEHRKTDVRGGRRTTTKHHNTQQPVVVIIVFVISIALQTYHFPSTPSLLTIPYLRAAYIGTPTMTKPVQNDDVDVEQGLKQPRPKEIRKSETLPTTRTYKESSSSEEGDSSGGDNKSKSNNHQPAHDSADSKSVASISSEHSAQDIFKPRVRAASNVRMVVFAIFLLGLGTSAAILAFGIQSANTIQQDQFDRAATDVVQRIMHQFAQYENAASIVHNYCRLRNFTRQEFRDLYEYFLNFDGLDFKAMQFDPNVTHDMRAEMEAEAEEYYAAYYPHVNYRGFVGFETDVPKDLEPRSNQSFYFPIHYQEPVIGNEAALGLDYYSHISRRQTLMLTMETGEPALTDRLVLVKDDDVETRCGAAGDASYGVVLMHPGVELSNSDEIWPRDISSMVICIPSLLRVSTVGQSASSDVYIYDSTDSSGEVAFLGGVRVTVKGKDNEVFLTYLPEIALDDLQTHQELFFSKNIDVASKVWTAAVVGSKSTYKVDLAFVILCACITFISSTAIAAWICTSARKTAKFNEVQAASDAERAALVLKSAREATKAERELNDFISHEVRNPVAAAMAACSFVKTEIHKEKPLQTSEALDSAREDVDIIDKSLSFVNDLLRNMLDMHRAASNQLKVELVVVDVLHDILEPVAAMLHQRGGKVKVLVDCKKNTYAMADPLRLKQVILNLGRNSAKFVERGFIKLRARKTLTGRMLLMVEDTGPGIPEEKGDQLFNKYQESLDVLSQGTGIGLFLCQSLTQLMGGKIYLDKTYQSGIEGSPGARFVVDLKAASEIFTSGDFALAVKGDQADVGSDGASVTTSLTGTATLREEELPDKLSILFVDDSNVLRKLFRRSIQVVAPNWEFREAANGEAALRLAETETFDLIFCDQYMASVEVSKLGTETVAELRRNGVTSRICGLSANDLEAEFLKNGANAFMMKPFPTDPKLLTSELLRVLYDDVHAMRESAKFD